MARKNNRRQHSKPIALVAVLLLIIGLGFYLWLRPNSSSGVIKSTNPLQASSPSDTGSSAVAPSSNSSSSTDSVASGPPPLTPSGNFVSSHHPADASSTEASTCNTSPGAVCYIQFTKGAEVKKLDTRTTDERGGAIWYWNIGDAGLSSGSWTITAVSELNGQIKTANDAQALVVQ